MKNRIVILFIIFGAAWTLLLTRGAILQIFPNQKLDKLETRQFQSVINLNSRRGTILDRNGVELAISSPAYSLFADPSIIVSKRWVSRVVGKELNIHPSSVFEKIEDRKKRFIWIARQVSPQTYEKIKAYKIRGLSFVEEPKRIYPNENLLSQAMGFVGLEAKGLEGIELSYDQQLKGNSKKITVKKDARGRPLVAEGLLFTESPGGSDLTLTIDREIQYVLERELKNAVSEHQASSAVGIVLDAKTSGIIAIGSAPTYDANEAAAHKFDIRRNRAVTDIFEPGSTLKTFVIAGALREGLLQPNSKYFCENGTFKIGKRVIREADVHHSFGFLSVSEILSFSSNIGTTKIALQMGSESVRKTFLDFGFGKKTGVDLPGDASGLLHKLPWHDHLLSNISFGHGVATTPLQIANAYAVIANGGVLRTPHIVKEIKNGETGEVSVAEFKDVRRVLTESEAEKMRLLLTGVTAPGGTGVNAKVPGYLVAGKTGTAQKVNPNGKGYLSGEYISSFAGFIPANDPRFVIYIAVDSPKKNYYGSQVAAPVFSKVAAYSVRRAGIAPLVLSENDFFLSKNSNKEVLKKKSLIESISVAELKALASVQEQEEVPDFNGLSAREVLRRARGQNYKVVLKGTGLVHETDPRSGSMFPPSRKIVVWLKDRSEETQLQAPAVIENEDEASSSQRNSSKYQEQMLN